MSASQFILAIDQGTTSTRSIVFDASAQVVGTAQAEFAQHYPADGWVEHDPEDIWRDVQLTFHNAMAAAHITANDVAAIGITNQRETVVLWDRKTGQPLYNAIVWQDRRTAAQCTALKQAGHELWVRAKTGLLLDPYFSATKLAWLLDHVEGARERAVAGELAFGTIDSFLLWRLTEGRVHKTDATNASRTLLFDIHKQDWCPELLSLFNIPASILPEVCDSSEIFGTTTLFGGSIPIAGIAGDQQAALIGQRCFSVGSAKMTYGTGGFMLLNTGDKAIASENKMLTTTAYRLKGKAIYALEGSIFVAGAAIKWLRDELGLFADAAQTSDMASKLIDNGSVYLVPAFVGLGAPYWESEARGLIAGLSLNTKPEHIVRAALEAVAYQTLDLLEAMTDDGAIRPTVMHIDGGMAENDWMCQFLADVLNITVERPQSIEMSALGAATLAGITVGLWADLDKDEMLSMTQQYFKPTMSDDERKHLIKGWRRAIAQTRLLG